MARPPQPIRARNLVPDEAGFLIYGSSKSNLNFHGGKLCVKAPFTRLSAKVAKANGSPPCSGVLNRNFNQSIQGGLDPALTLGATVTAQVVQRDPLDPAGFGDSFTNAVQFVIAP